MFFPIMRYFVTMKIIKTIMMEISTYFKLLVLTFAAVRTSVIVYANTVKLGCNELGNNEHSVITNKFFSPKRLFYYTNQPGYNKTRL